MTQKLPTEKEKFTSYQLLIVILLSLTQFSVVLDFMIMNPLGDIMIKSMSLTTSQFGWAVSAYAFSAGISGLLTAGFADRFDRKKLLLFFYIGFIGGTLFCGLANNYHLLIVARIITGIFGGVIGAVSMAIVIDLFSIQQRGRAVGFMQMGFGASQVLGIPISLYFANHWSWQAPFLMIVVLASLTWILIVFRMNPVNKHLEIKTTKNPLLHLWHTIKLRKYRIGFLTTALLSFGGFMMMPWSSSYAVNNLKVSPENLSILFMVAGIASLIIMPVVGKLSDKFDKVKIFSFAAIWMIIIVLIYTNLPPIPFYLVMVMNVLMMMGIMSRIVPAMALVTSLPQMQDRGAFMSINSSLQQMAGGVAAALSGKIVVQANPTSPLEHYNTLGYVITGVLLLNILMVYRVNKIIKSQVQPERV